MKNSDIYRTLRYTRCGPTIGGIHPRLPRIEGKMLLKDLGAGANARRSRKHRLEERWLRGGEKNVEEGEEPLVFRYRERQERRKRQRERERKRERERERERERDAQSGFTALLPPLARSEFIARVISIHKR